jgi:hypothetical protein
VDEKELLRTQIKSYEFYAGLIERAVGGGAGARLPRWDEQRAIEYRDLAAQLRQRLAELEAQEAAGATSGGASQPTAQRAGSGQAAGQTESAQVSGSTTPAGTRS